ncbi:MAG: zinc-ribbon domain-containing protein [Limisphaerales bacterium]
MKRSRPSKHSARDMAEAKRIAALHPEKQKRHPRAVKADHTRLVHINTYGRLPEYYIDLAFTCRDCGKEEIWRAKDQKWYYEEAKGHIDATAVRCRSCRAARKKRIIEPGASPNGGPAPRLENSDVDGGPPSVS